jgi:16S rRNA U516 pseudouridylate synthase RsuA-like enzyme
MLKRKRVCVDGEAESSFSFRVHPCMVVAVDGMVVCTSNTPKVRMGGNTEVDLEGIEESYLPQVLVFNKPEGIVTTMSDELGR